MLTILSYIGFIVACFAFAWCVWSTVSISLYAVASAIATKGAKWDLSFYPFVGCVAFTYIMSFLFIF